MMFTTTHIHAYQHRRPSALRTFITSSSFGRPDSKEPLRRGILLTAVACVLLLIGSLLTWLGFNDVFGGKMSMTGPLLIALALLLLLLSVRQFLLACKRNGSTRSSMRLDAVGGGTVTAVVVNHDDGLHPATIIMDHYDHMSYDHATALHRHSVDDCAPPSYHEVTQMSSSSNTPSCTTHDEQDELPPTYEESLGAAAFPSYIHVSQSPAYAEHEMGILISTPSIPPAPSCTGYEAVRVTMSTSAQFPGILGPESMAPQCPVLPTGAVYPSSTNKSPLGNHLSSLQLEPHPNPGAIPTLPNHSIFFKPSIPPASLPPGQRLTPPPLHHMSAPSSPRQLSAPASPRHLSAPSSPRQPCYPSSPRHLSAPISPCQFSAPLSPGQFHFPPAHELWPSMQSSEAQGSSHDGYTCFTFNFSVALPQETQLASPAPLGLQSHQPFSTMEWSSTICSSTVGFPRGQGQRQYDNLGSMMQPVATQQPCYASPHGSFPLHTAPGCMPQGDARRHQRVIPLTDIQESI